MLSLSCGLKLGCSSRVGTGILGKCGSCRKSVQATFTFPRREFGIPPRHCSVKRPHLALRGRILWFFPCCEGTLRFLLACNGNLRDTPIFPLISQVSFSTGEGHVGIPLRLLPANRAMSRVQLAIQETQCSSAPATGTSGFLLKIQLEVRPHPVLRHGLCFPLELSNAVRPCRVQARNLGFFKRISRGVRPLIIF